MNKEFEILGESRVVQYADGNAKVQISETLEDDLPMYITFLAMNVEVLANKIKMPVSDILELIGQNIEVEPMEFEQEAE